MNVLMKSEIENNTMRNVEKSRSISHKYKYPIKINSI